MLFALPVADSLALLRRCTLPGCLRPQSYARSVGLRLLDWQLEVHDALQQPPIVRLYSEPWIYYRAVQALAPGAVTSAGMLPHQELLSRFEAGRRLQPSGWVYALVRTAAPFWRAEHSLRRGLPYRTLTDPTNSEMARLTPAILKLTRKLHLRETRPTLWV